MRREKFWDGKIVAWERSRYRTSNPVSARCELAARCLQGPVQGQTVADLGCGTGRLLAGLTDCRKIGVDLSLVALAQAQQRCPEAHFQQADVSRGLLPQADLYVALGLLDWLKPSEISGLFQKFQGRPFLCSFSEKRFSPWRILHQIYVFLSYGWRQPDYVPRYDSASEMQRLARQAGYRETFVLRHPRLHFGAFLSSFCHEIPQ